jgi:hypothetical protein
MEFHGFFIPGLPSYTTWLTHYYSVSVNEA